MADSYYQVAFCAILCMPASTRRDEVRAKRDGTKIRETVLDAPIDFLKASYLVEE